MRQRTLLAALLAVLFLLTACGAKTDAAPAVAEEPLTETATEAATGADSADEGTVAVYLGVENYGAAETNKEHRNEFNYRFDIGGTETILKVDNGTPDSEGNYSYPIQNLLKEGYTYRLTLDGDTVTGVAEQTEQIPYTPPVQGEPGTLTVSNLLKTALEPVGTTLYVYGGGWDWQDEGSSVQARTLGVSSDWVRFFRAQDEQYNYKTEDPKTSYFPYGEYNEYYYVGLDCSGYMGWVIYNTFETTNGAEGYVSGSTGMAKGFSERGWGSWTQEVKAPDAGGAALRPGDIVSIKGHVYVSLGTCSDGSVVIAHCTPSLSRANQPGGGVQLSAIGRSESCEAYQLADRYLSANYPDWYARYGVYLCDPDLYFTIEGEKAGLFSWDTANGPMTDPEGLRDMTPAQVLESIYGSVPASESNQ